jgi:hypothetical protein
VCPFTIRLTPSLNVADPKLISKPSSLPHGSELLDPVVPEVDDVNVAAPINGDVGGPVELAGRGT